MNAAPGPSAAELDQAVAVVGIARNCAQTVERTVRGLQAALPPFRAVEWRVVESDSSDDTVAALQRLAGSIEGFAFESLGQLDSRWPDRTQRLAHCRNATQDLVRLSRNLDRLSHVVVVDLDGIIDRPSTAALASCWQRSDWAVCAANPEGPYYDVWALRHPQWCPSDCWREAAFLREHGVDAERAAIAAVYSRMITIAPDREWIEVHSAFGGLAVYRAAAWLAARYDGRAEDGAPVCEHVPLHAAIRAAGGRVFVNPRLVASSAAAAREHLPRREDLGALADSFRVRAALRMTLGRKRAMFLRRMLKSVT